MTRGWIELVNWLPKIYLIRESSWTKNERITHPGLVERYDNVQIAPVELISLYSSLDSWPNLYDTMMSLKTTVIELDLINLEKWLCWL